MLSFLFISIFISKTDFSIDLTDSTNLEFACSTPFRTAVLTTK